MKILFIHNIITPYRIPLFESLANEYHLHVVFLERRDDRRNWNQNFNKLNFDHTVLKNKNYRIFDKKIVRNYGLNRIFKEYNPDVLVTIDNPPNFLILLQSILLAKKRKIPIILWTGVFGYYKTFQKNKFKNRLTLYALRKIRKSIYSYVNFFWAYSKETKKHLIDIYKIDEKIIIVGLQGYPDELIFFQKVNTEERYRGEKLLFIGYLDERKGMDLFLKVFIDLIGQHPTYTLEIIGVGKLYERYKKKYGDIKNIRFLGYVDGVRKFDAINKSKYLVLPSISDPWGWVVNEATSLKLPALVSNSVMAKEILDDEQLIFKTNSTDDLKLKLEHLMLLPYDKYLDLSKNVYQNSRRHTMSKSIDSIKSILKSLK